MSQKSFREFLDGFVEEIREEALGALRELISIKSVREDPVKSSEGEVYPFGKGVQDAFSCMLSHAEEDGFAVENVENYGGHIELKAGEEAGGEPAAGEEAGGAPAKREMFGILAHLDVVPEGEGWSHEPYAADVEDGFLWGRGTTDDKGPLVASYYAMKAVKEYIKEADHRLDKDIRLILGLDEETEWEGMDRYFDAMPKPDLGFTPDAYFPVVYGEKGVMNFRIAEKLGRTALKGLELRKLSGGTAVNMVPDHARAVVNDRDPEVYDRITEMAEAYEMSTGHKLRVHRMGKSLEISATGKAAHGSRPEKGLNAISILAGFLGELNFVNEDISNFFDFYNACIGFSFDGSLLGCSVEDEESGGLVLNAGTIEYDGKAISLGMNVRYPVTKKSEEVYDLMMPKIDEFGLGVLKEDDKEPIYFDRESEVVQTYLKCYRDITGDKESEPLVMAGGTYARSCSNVIAFGALRPGDPDLMHRKDEKIAIDHFTDLIKIYAEALHSFTVSD